MKQQTKVRPQTLKAGQWWKRREGEDSNVVVFHVSRVFKRASSDEPRADIELWKEDGTKDTSNLTSSPDDLHRFERCSKHEALARLL